MLLGGLLGAADVSRASEVVVRFLGETASGRALGPAIREFNEQHKGRMRVDPEMVTTEAVLPKVMPQFMGGTGTYDVVQLVSFWLPQVWQHLHPLDAYVKRAGLDVAGTYGPVAARDAHFETGIVGLPVRFGTDILFYRKDLLQEAGLGVPRTLNDLLATARKITKKGADGKPVVYGMAIKAKSPQWTLNAFASNFYMPNGGRLLTADLKRPHPGLKAPFTVEILKTMKAFVDEGLVPTSLAWTFEDNVLAFQQGKLGLAGEFSARALLLEDPRKSQAAGRMGYATLPSQPLGPEPPAFWGSTWNLAIDKQSKAKDAAWEFIRYMTSPPVQRKLALEHANGPTVMEVYTDPEYVQKNPAASAIKEVLARGYTHPLPVPQQPVLQQIVHEEIQLLLSGRKSPEEVANALYARMEAALKH